MSWPLCCASATSLFATAAAAAAALDGGPPNCAGCPVGAGMGRGGGGGSRACWCGWCCRGCSALCPDGKGGGPGNVPGMRGLCSPSAAPPAAVTAGPAVLLPKPPKPKAVSGSTELSMSLLKRGPWFVSGRGRPW
eukprot:1094197-Pelagomonas_calceolata.AAC.2